MPTSEWTAVLRSADLSAGHIEFVQVAAIEIALWRDAAGAINAWENRCPHRGVRLTIGSVSADELTCRYHGWRFRTQTGACTFIPAHPTQPPPPASRLTTFPATERYGLVWVHLAQPAGPPFVDGLPADALALRSLVFRCGEAAVADVFARELEPLSAGNFRLVLDGPLGRGSARLFVQAEDGHNSVVHGVIEGRLEGQPLIDELRAYNERLKTLRRLAEASSVHAA